MLLAIPNSELTRAYLSPSWQFRYMHPAVLLFQVQEDKNGCNPQLLYNNLWQFHQCLGGREQNTSGHRPVIYCVGIVDIETSWSRTVVGNCN